MQRHDDEVRNNVIHPLCNLAFLAPFRPLANAKSDGSGDKSQTTEKEKQKRKEKRQGEKRKKKGSKTDDQRGNQKCHNAPQFARLQDTAANAQAKNTHFPSHPLPCPFGDRIDPVCSSYVPVNLSLFPKAISCSSLKATTNQAFRRSVEPIKRHPALGPLSPQSA